MIRALLARLPGWLPGTGGDAADAEEKRGEPDEETDEGGEPDEETDEGGFLPSRLDASVLEAHGARTVEAERGLAELDDQGDQLEAVQEERRRNQ